MRKAFFKPVLIFAGIVFLCGLLTGLTGSLMGGNPFRASANIKQITDDESIINFDYNITTEATPVPHNNDYYGDGFYSSPDIFSDPDIYDFFEEFGMDGFDEFFSPYGGSYDTYPPDSGVIY